LSLVRWPNPGARGATVTQPQVYGPPLDWVLFLPYDNGGDPPMWSLYAPDPCRWRVNGSTVEVTGQVELTNRDGQATRGLGGRMTLALLIAALILTLAGFLVLLDRRDTRDRAERQMLLQRIQNPQAAVHEHHQAVTPPDPPASPLPMSDEEMAEMMDGRIPSDLAAAIAKIEAVENGSAQLEDGLLR
jgi:hypothetical protein